MNKSFFLPSISFFICFICFPCYSQIVDLSFADRLSDWKERANAHENQVALLLAQPQVPRSNFELPEATKSIDLTDSNPSVQQVDMPFIPVPEYIEEEPEDKNETELISPASSTAILNVSESNTSSDLQQNVDEAYADLYNTDRPVKHEGFYLGLISGVLFPGDVVLREPSGISPSHPDNASYDADTGYMVGLQIGHDFGFVKVEADYSYFGFDANRGSDTLDASIHNIFSRFILEKELSDRFDCRLGLGMGMGITDFEGSTDYLGTGFAYDFLLGAGYRLSHDWSFQVDYRYYLTAASEDFDHVKSHMLLLSAHMDL